MGVAECAPRAGGYAIPAGAISGGSEVEARTARMARGNRGVVGRVAFRHRTGLSGACFLDRPAASAILLIAGALSNSKNAAKFLFECEHF
jgi:hypothetical protein